MRELSNVKMTVSESHRMYASISFVAVLIVVGIPLWWKTTEVYRVSLPYGRIADVQTVPVEIFMSIQIASSNKESPPKVENELRKHLSVSNLYSLHFEHAVLPKKVDESKDSLVSTERGPGTIRIIEWPRLEVDVFVTSSRTIYFSPEASLKKVAAMLEKWILGVDSLRSTIEAMSMSSNNEGDVAGRRRMPPSESYDISLSVAVPNPDKIEVEWSPKEALEQYIQPFVSDLSAIHNFTLKSQWLYFVQLDFKPKQIPDDTDLKRHYSLPEDTLPHLITPLEKKLASHISNNPCINFVLYTPPCEQSPIFIYGKNGKRINSTVEAFLSPRWGGVVIGNPPTNSCVPYLNGDGEEKIPVYKPPTKNIMGYFLSQLRLLIGIQSQQPINGVEVEPLKTVSPRKWELDALMRIRTIEQLYSAKLTLRSLSQLLGEISNIVINDDVGASVYRAVDNIELTIELLKVGKTLEALAASREAFLSAEAAFTDPSLLALLYFPDDQKYAVYIPLFLPIMIPVILSFKNIWKWLKGKPTGKEKTE